MKRFLLRTDVLFSGPRDKPACGHTLCPHLCFRLKIDIKDKPAFIFNLREDSHTLAKNVLQSKESQSDSLKLTMMPSGGKKTYC